MTGKREDKREMIITAARKIFARYGFAKTTLDDIGDAVGMKKNSLYHYFASKEDLFNVIINREADNFFDHLLKAIEKEKKSSGKLRKLSEFGIEFFQERVNIDNFTVAAKLEIVSLFDNFFVKYREKETEIIKNILRSGIENKEFINHDYDQLALDILDMLNALHYREHQKSRVDYVHDFNYDELKRKVKNLMNLLIEGLRHK